MTPMPPEELDRLTRDMPADALRGILGYLIAFDGVGLSNADMVRAYARGYHDSRRARAGEGVGNGNDLGNR